MFDTNQIHPLLVHFPIVLIIVGFVAELLSKFWSKDIMFSKAAYYLMVAAAIATFAAYVAGEMFTPHFIGELGKVRGMHALFARITFLFIIAGAVIRIYINVKKINNNTLNWIVFIFYAIAMLTVSITALLGNTLVYKYMIGA